MKPSCSVRLVCLSLVCVATLPAQANGLLTQFSFSGNAAIVNDYRFRGYSQTNFKPSVQLGFDIQHQSGLYVGNWNANVSDDLFPKGNLEMDFYGGWKGKLGSSGLGLDVGVLYYYYPGSDASRINNRKRGAIDNLDFYIGLDYDAGRYGSYKLKYSYTPGDFFKAPDSKGTWYLSADATYPLGSGWSIDAHMGYQRLKNASDRHGGHMRHYIDYKLGLNKDIHGWVIGLAAVGATRNNWYATSQDHNAGRIGALLSLSTSF